MNFMKIKYDLKKSECDVKVDTMTTNNMIVKSSFSSYKKNIEEKKSLGPVESDKNILNP